MGIRFHNEGADIGVQLGVFNGVIVNGRPVEADPADEQPDDGEE